MNDDYEIDINTLEFTDWYEDVLAEKEWEIFKEYTE